MKIVFLDTLTLGDDIDLSRFSTVGEVVFYPMTKGDETIERLEKADVVVTNKVVIDKNVIDNCPHLKLIAVAATGTNNIDISYAEAKGIKVRNAVNYSTNSVVQYTFAVILQFLNQINYYHQIVASGEYANAGIFTNLSYPMLELAGKTIGIIGMGNIGKKVAEVAAVFGMKVIYYSTSGKNKEQIYDCVDLVSLIKTADIVSIHAPLNDKTKNLINKSHFPFFKQNAILLNVGRGGIVNELDLATYLKSNLQQLRVGLDVYVKEPLDAKHPLMDYVNDRNVIFTPHLAWGSVEARKELMNQVYDHINGLVLM